MNEDEKNLNPNEDTVTEEVVTEETVTEEPVTGETEELNAPAAEEPIVAEPVAKATSAVKGIVAKLGTKLPAIIAAAAAVVVVGVAVIASAASSSPLATLKKGFTNSFEALKKNEVVSTATSVAESGSIEVISDLESLIGFALDGEINVKLYLSSALKAALVANVEMDKETLFDASITVDKNNIAIGSEVLFDDDVYGLSLKNLADRFNESEFGPDGDLYTGIELPETLNSIVDNSTKTAEEAEKILENTVAALMKSVKENAEMDKEKETLKFNGTEVKTTAVTIDVNPEAMAAIVRDMLDYVREDKDLKEFLYDNAHYSAMLMDEMGMIYGYNYGYYDSPEEALDEVYETLNSIEDEDLEYLVETFEDAGFEASLTFYIANSGKQLVGVSLNAEADGDPIKFSIYAGPSWDKLEEISFRFDDGYDVYRASYTVDANDKNEYAAELKIREDNEIVFSGEFVWDKKDGDFEIEFTDDWGDVYGAEGKLEVTSKSTAITLESIREGSYEKDLAVSVIIKSSDKMPSMPKYTDVLDMSADELEDLVYDLQDIIEDLEYMFW